AFQLQALFQTSDFRLGNATPGVFRQHVLGHRAQWRLEQETGAADERAVRARPREVRAGGPLLPLTVVEGEKRARVADAFVCGPADVSRDVGVRGVADE